MVTTADAVWEPEKRPWRRKEGNVFGWGDAWSKKSKIARIGRTENVQRDDEEKVSLKGWWGRN